jgi:hypothetical protein
MIRILIIDDLNKPEFIDEMKGLINQGFAGVEVQPIHLNPVSAFGTGDQRQALQAFLEIVRRSAEEFWDVAIIDINLAEVKLPEDERLHLSLSIAEAFRERNRSATLILYSGTLSTHVDKLLKGKTPAEVALKRIFRADVSLFVPRNRNGHEVFSAIDNPSWLLRIDRLLMKHATQIVSPEEAEFKGRSFADLAMAVRRQDHAGQKICQLTAEFGIGCLADLNLQ